MNEEEVKIKLGFDSSAVGRTVETVKERFSNLGAEAEKTFTNADSAGKKWNNAMNVLTDQCPILGYAISTAFSPIAGLVALGTAAVMAGVKAFDDYNKQLDEIGEKAARRPGDPFKTLSDAKKGAAKAKAEQSAFERDLKEGKPGENDEAEHQRKLARAKEEAGGIETIYLAKKKLIDHEYELEQIKKRDAAAVLERELSGEKGAVTGLARDRAKENAIKGDEDKIKELETERARLNKLKLENKDDGGIMGSALRNSAIVAAAFPEIVPKSVDDQIAEVDAEIQRRRGLIAGNEGALNADTAAGKNEQLSRAKAEFEAHSKILKAIEKERIADAQKLKEEESKQRKDATDHDIAMAEAKAGSDKRLAAAERIAINDRALTEAKTQGDKMRALELEKALRLDLVKLVGRVPVSAKDLETLNDTVNRIRSRPKEEELAKYRPELDEIAGSYKWLAKPFARVQHARDLGDQIRMNAGGTFIQKHAVDASLLKLTEHELKSAMRIDGPDSKRFKDALKQRDTLKAGLEKAGLLKPDKFESMEESLKGLFKLASTDGLAVQPINGK